MCARTACLKRGLLLYGSASVCAKRRRCPCVLPRRLRERFCSRLRPHRVRGPAYAVHGRVPAGRFPSAGRPGDEKVYTLSSPRSAGRAFSVKILLKSCAEGRMCYNFFNKKPHRSLMKTRILSRNGAGPAGAALYGAPSGSGNMHTAGRRRFRTVFPPAAAGPDASRRESRVFSFRFSARFVAMLCMKMYNYKISQRDHSVCDGATAAETFL